MGQPTLTSGDSASILEPGRSVAAPYMLTAGGVEFTPWMQFQHNRRFNVSAWGGTTPGANYGGAPTQIKTALQGTIQLEKSFDGGRTIELATYDDGAPASWTNMVYSGGWNQDEPGVLWRLRVTSGTAYWRMAQ